MAGNFRFAEQDVGDGNDVPCRAPDSVTLSIT